MRISKNLSIAPSCTSKQCVNTRGCVSYYRLSLMHQLLLNTHNIGSAPIHMQNITPFALAAALISHYPTGVGIEIATSELEK